MTGDVLAERQLNRATLARQLLLERSTMPIVDAVEHLVGLQAQEPLDPYVALWSRLVDLDFDDLGALLTDRSLVRIVVMRGTIHLTTPRDAAFLRPLMQPVLDNEIRRHSEFAPQLVGVDVAPVLEFAEALLGDTPLSTTKLRAAIAERFPDLPAAALAYACRCHLPLVQVPPRGVWGKKLQVTLAPLEAFTGVGLRTAATIDEAVLRYLAAFGPAMVADVAAWSRLTGMREVIDRLGPRLRRFTDARGRELVDLPDAPRPHEDTPAPVRLLPAYDNVLLSHADRSRFGPIAVSAGATANGRWVGGVLVDGVVAGLWRSALDAERGVATITVEHQRIPADSLAELGTEADALVRRWHPTADDHRVELVPYEPGPG
jgi:hypothetical protein